MSSIYLLVLKPKNISFPLLRFNLASAPSSFSLVFFQFLLLYHHQFVTQAILQVICT